MKFYYEIERTYKSDQSTKNNKTVVNSRQFDNLDDLNRYFNVVWGSVVHSKFSDDNQCIEYEDEGILFKFRLKKVEGK